MKILVVSQYYYPEPFRISDMCEDLAERGHEVTVLTGIPNYPMGEIYPGYDKREKIFEVINGVRVFRSWTVPRHQDSIHRLLNYHSFALSSALSVLFDRIHPEDGGLFDVVFVYQTSPIMQAQAAIQYGKKHQVPVVLYCLDLWPESLVVGGVSKNSLIYKFYRTVSKKIYQKVSCVLMTSVSFKDYFLEELSLNDMTFSYLPQFAEDLFQPMSYNSDKDTVDLVFAGNIGTAQNLEVVIEAAKQLQVLQEDSIHFHIVGDGQELAALENMVEEQQLSTVHFYGRRSVEEMPSYYAMADAMLVTLKDLPGMDRTLPGKVQSYLASGKPIIASINGETERVLKETGCSLVSAAEDVDGLVNSIQIFSAMSPEERRQMGLRARALYEEQFSKEKIMTQLEKILLQATR